MIDDELLEYDAALRESPPTHPISMPPWHARYQYDLYDWNDPWFKKLNKGKDSYRAIPLTKGYFMIVDTRDYRRMTEFPDSTRKRWYADVKYFPDERSIKSIYARRSGRGDEPANVYAHREVLDCLHDPGEGDHINGEGLDNRQSNLLYVSRSQNIHNTVRTRPVFTGLPRGVVLRGKNRLGQQLYGGQRCVRRGKKVKTFRTKRTWLSPEPAAKWYQNQLKKLHRRSIWAHKPKSFTQAVFPPRIESEPIPFPLSKVGKVAKTDIEEIPF